MAGETPQKIVFVGGAPRSGTTVAHALICTGEGVSAYNPEVSFFRGFMVAFRNGRASWDQHTSAFFSDPAAFAGMIRQASDLALSQVWATLGRAPILALKDPHLTPYFPDVHRIYPQEARFVTVCRHPVDVVRSRQEVHEKSGAAHPFGPSDVAAVAREYVSYYNSVLQTNFGGRHFMFRYEDLNSDELRASLAAFVGVPVFDSSAMWGAETGKLQSDAWGSPKYNKPIDLNPRLTPLAEDLRKLTLEICAPVAARMGYS